MNIQRAKERASEIIRIYEGCHLTSYKCPAGKWTIGWGHTKGVKPGDIITMEKAKEFLLEDMDEAVSVIQKTDNLPPLTDNQMAALISFVFNIKKSLWPDSTLVTELRAKNFNAIPEQLIRWTKATVGGKKIALKGLVRRRLNEALLFMED